MIDAEKGFQEAREGRLIWLEIKRKYSFTNMFGLTIFPTKDFDLNSAAITLLNDYKKQMFLQKIVAVTNQEDVFFVLTQLGCSDIFSERISDYEMRCLLKYYQLVKFCAHIAVVSLYEPFGNYSLIRDGGIDMKKYIFSAIYKVR
jgi:hypothetical protein